MSSGRMFTPFVIAALASYLLFATYKLGVPDLRTDEGRYGIAGLNVRSDVRQLLIVSTIPGGGPDGSMVWVYPVLLGASTAMFGRNELALRLVNVLLLAGAAWWIYRFVTELLNDRRLGAFACAFFLANPATMSYARTVMVEPSVFFWGCAALVCAAVYRRSAVWRWPLLCGLALGMAFLSKLWLALPFGLPCFVMLASTRARVAHRFIAIALCGGAFLLLAGSHLSLLALVAPEHVHSWLYFYFGRNSAARVAGIGYDPAMWYRPWWFYAAAVFKCTFFVLPLVILGIWSALRERGAAVYLTLGAFFVPAIAFSFMTVKLAAYVFFVYPALAALTALGWDYFVRTKRPREILTATLVSAALGALLVERATAAPLVNTPVVTAGQFGAMLLLYVTFAVAALPGVVLSRWGCRLSVCGMAAAMLVSQGLIVRRQLAHRLFYREVAAFFEAPLRLRTAGAVSFTAPEYPSISFRVFRHGQYWPERIPPGDFQRELESGNQLFYVVDSSGELYGGTAPDGCIGLLRSHAHEVTGDIERKIRAKLPYRVFVPSAHAVLIRHGLGGCERCG